MQEDFHKDEQILPIGYLLAGRYVLDTFLGSGGMGAVYLALDRLLENKLVAIKVLHKEFSRDAELTRRFLREVNMMHSVNHPNVVRTYDAGVQDGMFFFTMEYIEGLLLDRYLETLGRDYVLLGKITTQICKGLEAIHNQNIVHRDLKPGNILVSNDGTVKITDFGVARPVSSGHTAHREIMGSLDYIPPEVFQGNQISPASDFYSLGVILYGIVCGVFPFDAEDPMAIVWKHVNEIPATPSSKNPEVPQWMDKLIMRLLEKDPLRRPQNARQIIRFVRENIFKDGKVLDSGAHNIQQLESTAKANSIHDTDLFELDFDPSELEPCSLDEESALPNSDSFTSACNAVIFDALPTVDEIRQHEEMWEERKKKRAEGQDLKGLAAKIKQAEKNDEIKKLRIIIQIVGVVVVFSVLMAIIASFTGGVAEDESEDEEEEIASVSMKDLRKNYMTGKADEIKKSKKKPKKTSSWGINNLFVNDYNAHELQSLSFNRLNTIKSGASFLAGESPKLAPSVSYGTVNSVPYENIEQKSTVSRQELDRLMLTQPAISTVYQGYVSSPAAPSRLPSQINEPSQIQRQQYVEKQNLKQNLSVISGQLEAYNIQDEQLLLNKEITEKEELDKISTFQQTIESHLSNQLDKQKAFNSFITDLDKGGILKVAKELVKVNPKVAERLTKYEQSQQAYAELMDSIKDGKINIDKIALTEASKELERQRDELSKTLKLVISENMTNSFKEMLESGVLSEVTKEKKKSINIENESRRNYWQKIKSGQAEDKQALELKKQELEKKLEEVEKQLPSEQESALKGLIAIESYGNNQ